MIETYLLHTFLVLLRFSGPPPVFLSSFPLFHPAAYSSVWNRISSRLLLNTGIFLLIPIPSPSPNCLQLTCPASHSIRIESIEVRLPIAFGLASAGSCTSSVALPASHSLGARKRELHAFQSSSSQNAATVQDPKRIKLHH